MIGGLSSGNTGASGGLSSDKTSPDFTAQGGNNAATAVKGNHCGVWQHSP